MKDFAIAISVYDKFQDVKLLVELIRENWPGDYYIAVCSSHPNPKPHLSDCAIDSLLTIDDFPLEGNRSSDWRVASRARLWIRVIDSLRKACSRCANKSNALYTLNLQADSCPLSWPKLQGLGEHMKQHGKYLAAKGEGFGFYSADEPVGSFDDMFVVIDNTFARESEFLDFEPFDLLPHKISIHGMLASRALAQVGLRHFYHYATYQQEIYWDGKPVVLHPLNSAHPMYFDPEYRFLHIHESAFPGDLGSRLKAYYFYTHGITKGKNIERFLEAYLMPESELFEKLKKMDRDVRKFFWKKGLVTEHYGRNYDEMMSMKDRYHDLSSREKMVWLAHMHANQLKGWCSKAIRNRYSNGRLFCDRYRESIWPERMDELYEQVFHNIPRELRDFSFEKEIWNS